MHQPAKTLDRRSFLMGTAASAAFVAGSGAWARPKLALRDPAIERLIRRMTLEEKAGQLSIFRIPGFARSINPVTRNDASVDEVKQQVREGRTTGFFNGFNVGFNRVLQEVAVTQSRLRIPLIFAADVIHGLRTAYPLPLAEASSFDPELCRRTARATAEEASAFGLHWTFAPMVDVARDQRWGRVSEGAGEDPWLGSLLAAARVRGFQGEDLRADDSLLACAKHFAAYGGVEGGMEYNTVDIPETTLRQTYLPPFEAAFAAGALSTMSAFNDVAGVPATGNRKLLTGILREEWGFRGLVVSDFESEKELIAHGFASDEADAVFKALWAGCDVSMESGLYNEHLPQLVRSGRLKEAVVDEAVRRVLRVKQALGLFENPYRSLDPDRQARVVRRPDMLALAREAARKSMVLLKNEGGLLPLPKTGKKIAFIGPYVSDKLNALGTWMVLADTANAVTLEEGVRAALGPAASVTFTKGSDPNAAIPGGIAAAVAAARDADVVVLYLGETIGQSGEAASRTSIAMPEAQQQLAEAVAATGKPMAVLLKHGRALALEGAIMAAPALMCTWFLGSESGNAIADVLFGDYAPQGRLPVSFPLRTGQEPYYYNHRSTGRPQTDANRSFKAGYADVPNRPAFPFGHGLGYSEITYGPTQADQAQLRPGGSVRVSARVTNTGARPHHEVVQLYIHDEVAEITQPVRVLRGIRHVALAPGETATVEFAVRAADLAFVHADNTTRADPGTFKLWIAPSAASGTAARVELV